LGRGRFAQPECADRIRAAGGAAEVGSIKRGRENPQIAFGRISTLDSSYDRLMNLLSLILVAMALIVAGCVFYVAWEFSSGELESGQAAANKEKEQGKSEES